jgi:hypothetical protein
MPKKTVYLVSVQGPEWNDPDRVYAKKDKADKRARKIAKALKKAEEGGDLFAGLSNTLVTALRLYE